MKLNNTELETYLNRIKTYCQKDPEIIKAFLFGSYSKNKANENSDIDLGFLIIDGINRRKKAGNIYYNLNLQGLIIMPTDIICINKNYPNNKNSRLFIEDAILNDGVVFYEKTDNANNVKTMNNLNINIKREDK